MARKKPKQRAAQRATARPQPAAPAVNKGGRPRNPDMPPSIERATASRARRAGEGYKLVSVMLTPEAVSALDRLKSASGKTITAIVNDALVEVAKL